MSGQVLLMVLKRNMFVLELREEYIKDKPFLPRKTVARRSEETGRISALEASLRYRLRRSRCAPRDCLSSISMCQGLSNQRLVVVLTSCLYLYILHILNHGLFYMQVHVSLMYGGLACDVPGVPLYVGVSMMSHGDAI
jgi:hypothetical protein